MKEKILLTRKDNEIISAKCQNDKIIEIQYEMLDKLSVGDIYVGKVRNVVKNINAAFVEFRKKEYGYLPLGEAILPVHVGGNNSQPDRVLIGDEIIIQVKKEALKTKPPTLTGAMELAGQYIVLTYGKSQVSISKKIKDADRREQLKTLLEPYVPEGFGVVIRTNGGTCRDEELVREVKELSAKFLQLLDNGKHRTICSCLYKAPASYQTQIRDTSTNTLEAIITDSQEIYESLEEYFENTKWSGKDKLVLWNPDQGKLDAVYDISRTVEKALKSKVWLKNGAYLVIQPTEALVSIDVNSGKAISKSKNVQNTFFKINEIAAIEIARQLRLRNLSGMILIDFIDMEGEDNQKAIMKCLREEVSKDPIQTTVVDMTALGLVEVTRKKIRKSLFEQIRECQDSNEENMEDET